MAFPEARRVFEEVDAALGETLSRLIWEGPDEQLTLTANAQPALMAVSHRRPPGARGARLRAWPTGSAYVAGHSLGEYSALAAAGALSLADTARLLRIRGNAMQHAVPVGEGAMAAILGLEQAEVEAVCAEAAALATSARSPTTMAADSWSFPGPRQLSKRAARLAHGKGRQARDHAAGLGAVPFGADAAGRRRDARGAGRGADRPRRRCRCRPMSPSAPLTEPRQIADRLIEQVTGRVRWRETIEWFAAHGVTTLDRDRCRQGADRSCAPHRPPVTTVAISTPAEVEAGLAALA